ncbi:DUF6957 family protein [Metapseudomonas boanensis]|nr:hypothetical protein [Pseudomonas boanensis]
MDILQAVMELLDEGGIPMLGPELADEEAIARARACQPVMSFCVVRRWIWIDLEMPESVLAELQRTGRQPVMLYAHQVVFDSLDRCRPGDWIRSTPLVAFRQGCFFETVNTRYLLLGRGVRKSAQLSTGLRIF